jgi:outer membrane protein OmpA-like peptidoglycan-associated protein
MIFYLFQQIKELNIMRKTIPALFIFVAFLFPFVLSSCAHISTPVPVDSDNDGVPDNYDYRYDFTIPQYYDKCPTSTPMGVKVDKYGCPLDDDKDGVPDYLDKCPGTPAGVKVGKDGCPLDSDVDGVPDNLDKCPGTPAGVKVEKDGCPIDSDGDGVPDYLDKCPGTPGGVKVEKDGCPIDSDGDGVPDYLDKCPGSPAGVKVDDNGCPIDSDGDGVPDYLDKCPGTTKGMAVDINGCPMAAAIQENDRVTLKVLFDFNMAVVKNQYHDEIGNLAEMMKKHPEFKIQIEGHTDSVGDAKYNEKLSQRRADAIRKYLVEKFGIDGSRLTAKGYGESRPVASNATEDGREKNRRVEAAAAAR